MVNAPMSCSGNESVSRQDPVYPRLRGLALWSALALLSVAVCVAFFSLHYASVCTTRTGAYDDATLAAGVLLAGMAFNWMSLNRLLTEFMPADWGSPAALSTLIWIVIMASALRMSSILLRVRRVSDAYIIQLALTVGLVVFYAVSSALGFCLVARS